VTSTVAWASVAASGGTSQAAHTCGLRTDGTAWCWGFGTSGERGDGTLNSLAYPVPVVTTGVTGTTWTSISTGYTHTCGVRDDKSAWCWGDNSYGALGNNNTNDELTPVQVKDSAGGTGWTDWSEVTAGAMFTCGVRIDGTAWCWGRGDAGQIGANTSVTSSPLPVRVGSGATLFSDWVHVVPVDVGGANGHACGVRANGTAWCWGDNTSGKLGDNTTTARPAPVQVKDSSGTTVWSDWVEITLRGNGNSSTGATCGRRSGGTVWCWGQNMPLVPTQIGTATDWIKVDAGGSDSVSGSACGIRADKTAWCWGSNWHGQLGNGMTSTGTMTTIPTQVVSDTGGAGWSDWEQIIAGDSASCGIRTGGLLYCWGEGAGGQLGNGAITPTSLPTKPL
jgi:alpha-tubulin suppressor-like RCC1 family protein